jgi:3-oxoacyl-[acyl-carrier protein] reductase
LGVTTGIDYGLSGRVAIVTGGGRNIGRAMALGLSAAGARIVVADLDTSNADAVAREIEAAGGQALAAGVDIGDRASVERMVGQALDRFQRVDILVNNASRFNDLTRGPFQEISDSEWRSALDVNVTGTFHCIRAVEAQMRQQRWGRVVNVSSGTVRMGRPDFLHYVTSKSALIGMTRSLARELGPFGITVNVLPPGVVFTDDQRTSLTPDYQAAILKGQCIPEMLTPQAMAGPLVFLCSDQSRYVTGQELAVDAGLTHG